MTITALPINASGGSPSYNARQTRQVYSALMMPGPAQLRTRSGFRPGGAPSVSVTSSTWTVGAFTCIIDAGVSAVQGPYLIASDANSTGSMTAADATFARKDLLYVQVSDTDEDGSGQRAAAVGYLAGNPAASPTAPSVPARSVAIGIIDVPHLGGGSPAFTATSPSTVAAGGILPVFSQAEQDALSAASAMAVARMDFSTPRLNLYDGTKFVPAGPRGIIGGTQYTGNGNLAAGVTATELMLNMTTGPVALEANRRYHINVKYKIVYIGGVPLPILRIRDTNVSGTVRAEFVDDAGNISAGHAKYFWGVYETSVAETKTWVLTGSTQTNSFNIVGGGTVNAAYITVEDMGPAGVVTIQSVP